MDVRTEVRVGVRGEKKAASVARKRKTDHTDHFLDVETIPGHPSLNSMHRLTNALVANHRSGR